MHSTPQQHSQLRVGTLVILLGAATLMWLSSTSVFAGTPPPSDSAFTSAAPDTCLQRLISDRAVNDTGTLAVRSSALGSPWRSFGRVSTSSVSYLSHTLGGEPVRIFGYYSRPARAAAHSVPGLLILHGAGGYAVRARAEEAASRGFAAIAIDMPGRGPDRSVSRSTGPDLSVENLFRLTPTVRHNYLYNAVHAARRGLTFLASRPEVDRARLGVCGISWGGVVTLLTSATDERVQAAVNLFGAGYLAEGSTWLRRLAAMQPQARECFTRSFDPASYAGEIACPVLSISATNDGCYWLPSFAATQGLMNSASRQLLLPNLDHKINSQGRQAMWAWLEGHLKRGQAVGARVGEWRCERDGDRLRVVCCMAGRHVPASVSVSYLTSGVGWARASWRTVRMAPTRGRFVAAIPGSIKPSYLYATATYRDGLSISTPVHTVCNVVYPYGARLVDAPFMSPGRLHGRAEELARQMGGQVVEASDGAQAVIAFGAHEVSVPARMVGGDSYVAIRGLADAIGAPVHWRNQTVTVSLPRPERIAQKLAGSAPAAPATTTSAPAAPVATAEPPSEPGTVVAPPTPEPAPAPVVRGRPTAVRTILIEPAKAMPAGSHSLGRGSSMAPARPATVTSPTPIAPVTMPPPAPKPAEASAGSGKQGGLVRMM